MNQPLQKFQLSLRTDPRNPDHHLWNNNGTWWCHFTLHSALGTKHRARRSLHTVDLVSARRRRDMLLAKLSATLDRSATQLQPGNSQER